MLSELSIIQRLVAGIYARTSWLMTMFLLLACFLWFSGGISQFRGAPNQVLDPFGFSLLTPSSRSFGPADMLSLACLLLLPTIIIDLRRRTYNREESPGICVIHPVLITLSAIFCFGIFLILSIPFLAMSSVYQGLKILLFTIADQFFLSIAMAFSIDLVLKFVANKKIEPIAIWITAGAFHLSRTFIDILLINPQVKDYVASGLSLTLWHLTLAFAVVTLSLIPSLFVRKHSAFFLLSILIVLSIPNTAHADRTRKGDIDITGSFGINGFFKEQTPSPLILNIKNSGDMFEGWLVVDSEGWVPPTNYTHPLLIAPGGTHRAELACFGCYQPGVCEIPVEIYSSDGDQALKEVFESVTLGQADSLVVHLGEPSGSLDNLNRGINPGFVYLWSKSPDLLSVNFLYSPRIFSTITDPDSLPSDPNLLECVNLLTMGIDYYHALSDEKKSLLADYVRNGGNLLVYFTGNSESDLKWNRDLFIPVDSLSSVANVSRGDIDSACASALPASEAFEKIYSYMGNMKRDSSGKVLNLDEIQTEGLVAPPPGQGVKSPDEEPVVENIPSNQPMLEVRPMPSTQVVKLGGSGSPILVVKNLGMGHTAFASFDIFRGNPSAKSDRIKLIASTGLLDPVHPSGVYSVNVLQELKTMTETIVRGFFYFGIIPASGRTMEWIEERLPVLIYLAVLPIPVLFLRRRVPLLIGFLIAWSFIMSGVILAGKRDKTVDKSVINEANLVWCEADDIPEVNEPAGKGTSNLYSFFVYGSAANASRTISVDARGVILDEFINSGLWPYRKITIEQTPNTTRLPNLPLELIAASAQIGTERDFILRRPVDDFTADGRLTIGKNKAHLTLNADAPFGFVNGILTVTTSGLIIQKSLGAIDPHIELDFNLNEETDIKRGYPVFPDMPAQLKQGNLTPNPGLAPDELGQILRRYWDHILINQVGTAQIYSTDRLSQRPRKAFLIMASTEKPSEITVAPGSLDRKAITIAVISIPIVYEDELAEK